MYVIVSFFKRKKEWGFEMIMSPVDLERNYAAVGRRGIHV